MMGTPDMKKFE